MAAATPTTAPVVEVPSIPLGQLAPWALFLGLLGLVALFFLTTAQGAVSVGGGTMLHEMLHDGRHLLGFPCH